jgi:hypothetical protein
MWNEETHDGKINTVPTRTELIPLRMKKVLDR